MENKVAPDNDRNIKLLTFLIYFLLAFLTFFSGWQQLQISKCGDQMRVLPKEYVSKERYLTDKADTNLQLKRIEAKIDRLIERELGLCDGG